MRGVSLVLLSIVCAMAYASDNSEKPIYDLANAETLFEDFIATHNKVYKDDADKKLHYEAFVANLAKINEQNKANSGASFGINQFADYTEEEWAAMRGISSN